MIGQELLLQMMDRQIEENTFPRFAILVGPKGGGKTLIAKHIAEKLNANYVQLNELKVDAVRDMIVQSYKIVSTTVYNISHADDMSLAAKNALLKVIEEPPNNAYFIMTLEDIYNTLPTIRSRGAVYALSHYTSQEILEYAKKNVVFNKASAEHAQRLYSELCDTPGEVKELVKFGAEHLYEFVCKVIDNISTCSGPNAFKIAQVIKLKDNDSGYDIKLFWKQFMWICMEKYQETNEKKYLQAIKITHDAVTLLRYRGVNKLMLFDKWILEIREEWM